jgi:signal transduction histidine kinase
MNRLVFLIAQGRGIKGMLLTYVFMLVIASISAQDKVLVQVKAFDQQLRPFKNIELSLNEKEYFVIGNQGTAFIELAGNELPVKSIKVKNDQLEAASWNYGKGILEVIIRKKSYRTISLVVKDKAGSPVASIPVTYSGRNTVTLTTNAAGQINIPLALDEQLGSESQFSVASYKIVSLQASENANVLTVARDNMMASDDGSQNKRGEDLFKDFDLSKLDSIQSLTVFYAVFKNFPMRNLSKAAKQRVDNKFYQLVAQFEDSVRRSQFIGKISDSSFVEQDVQNLLSQADFENKTLRSQREEFDKKIQLLNGKLAAGIENLDAETRTHLLDDIRKLESILAENENRFYKNQNEYRHVINSLKEKYFDLADLESKLSLSEAKRAEEQRVFRLRLVITVTIALVLIAFVVLLIYFSNTLRKRKQELEHANAEVKRINENLEGLVQHRTRMLEAANKELDTFLYRASHDLRSPICSIIGLCQLAGHFSNNETKELLNKMLATTLSMDKMLKKLTLISEIHEPTDFSMVKAHDIISVVKASLASMAKEHNVYLEMTCAEDTTLFTYPNLLEAILYNLVENALFFASLKRSQDQRVEVSATVENDILRLTVYDNGVGIEKQIEEKVFNMFYKGNVYSKGNGLGLFIVKKSVEALNGDIEILSEPGYFTRFCVSIPMKLSPKENRKWSVSTVSEEKLIAKSLSYADNELLVVK